MSAEEKAKKQAMAEADFETLNDIYAMGLDMWKEGLTLDDISSREDYREFVEASMTLYEMKSCKMLQSLEFHEQCKIVKMLLAAVDAYLECLQDLPTE